MKKKISSADPITTEVVRGLLDSAVEEVQQVLYKVSHSPLITDARDSTSALFDATGRTIAQATAVPCHLGCLHDLGRIFAKEFNDSAQDGDIYIHNDPYNGGTHLPDLAIVSPVIIKNKLIGYVATMSHHADIGGFAPGSVNFAASDLYAEGLILSMSTLVKAGKMNDSLFETILANSRVPQSLKGDLGGQIAACLTGVKRYKEIIAKIGATQVDECIDSLLDYAERVTRNEIKKMPNGEYYFEDFLDDDSLGRDSKPVKICLTLKVKGSNLEFDFSGTDKQVDIAINNVPSCPNSVVYYAVRTLTGDRVPNNEGSFRPITIHLPKGSIVNSHFPAPVAVRGITLKRVEDVVCGAMAKALPRRMTAAHSGQYTMVNFVGQDADGHRIQGHLGGPYAGGHGARSNKDGIDVTEHGATNGSPVPLEVSESKLPVLFKKCLLWTDSGGAGTWRGGLGYTAEVQWRGGDCYGSFRRDRMKFKPWGIEGGHSAPLCKTVVISKNKSMSLPGKIDSPLVHGDIIKIHTTGSGGFGDPKKRDPALVLEDLLDNKISAAAARKIYKVAIKNMTVNIKETAKLRS
jgi:N-methylhydantoinase B